MYLCPWILEKQKEKRFVPSSVSIKNFMLKESDVISKKN